MARAPKSPAAAAPAEAPASPVAAATKAVKTAPAKKAPVKKPSTKPASAKAAPAKKAAAKKPAVPVDKPTKPKKPKLVRDSFTIPKAEYEVLAALKHQAAALGQPAKKSEVLRAGILALARLSETALLAALAQVPAIKTGRPKKD